MSTNSKKLYIILTMLISIKSLMRGMDKVWGLHRRIIGIGGKRKVMVKSHHHHTGERYTMSDSDKNVNLQSRHDYEAQMNSLDLCVSIELLQTLFRFVSSTSSSRVPFRYFSKISPAYTHC